MKTKPTALLAPPSMYWGLLFLAGLVLSTSGCKLIDRRGKVAQTPTNTAPAETQEVIAHLNRNAKMIQSLKVNVVDIDAKAEGRPLTLNARLAYQEPNDFRLSARAVGKSQLDLGSNNDEIWFWVARANPPTVFFCKRDQLASAQFSTPFNPDWLVELLGLAPIDSTRYREGKGTDRYLTLVSNESTPGGHAVIKRLVIDRQSKRVTAFELFGPKAERLAHAQILDYTEDPQTGAFVPHKIRVDWPAAETKVTLTLRRGQTEINQLDRSLAGSLFVRGDTFAGSREVNLAQMQEGQATGPRHPYTPRRVNHGGVNVPTTQTAMRRPSAPDQFTSTNQTVELSPPAQSRPTTNRTYHDSYVHPAQAPAARLDGRIEALRQSPY